MNRWVISFGHLSQGVQMLRLAWGDALLWLLYTASGFLAPIFVGIFVGLAVNVSVDLEWVTKGGQFAVSGAGLLMTTSYFVARSRSSSRLPLTGWFIWASGTGLIFGATLFTLATLSTSGIEIHAGFYQIPSIVLFVIALMAAFLAVGLDNVRNIGEVGVAMEANQAARERVGQSFDDTFQETSYE